MSTVKATTLEELTSGVSRGIADLISGGARAWLMSEYSSGTPTVRDSMGVSSLTDTNTGQITVNWATAFANAYAATLPVNTANGLGNAIPQNPTASTVLIVIYNNSAAQTDSNMNLASNGDV